MAESVDNNVFIVLVFFLAFGVQELGPEALEKYSEFFLRMRGREVESFGAKLFGDYKRSLEL